MQMPALQSNFWQDFFSAMAESWKHLKDATAFFIVSYVLELKQISSSV